MTNLDVKEGEVLLAKEQELANKKEKSNAIVKTAVIAAGAIGASPIPMSDAPLIVGAQLVMIKQIFSTYKLEKLGDALSKTVLIGLITTAVGKSIAGSLMKMIPGVGTVTGGAVSAGVAASVTFAVGFAANKLAYEASLAESRGEDVTSIYENAEAMFRGFYADGLKLYKKEKAMENSTESTQAD